MLIHPTVERLRALGLTAMADAFNEMHSAPHARCSARLMAVAARRARVPSMDSMDDPQPT